MIAKVVDPNKIATDPVLLKNLAKQGIDKDYVEFVQDYAPRHDPLTGKFRKEHSPYAKFYCDLKSNKKFMVASGLPMVKSNGIKVEVGWIEKAQKFISKPNLFSAEVDGKQVKVVCLSDQPHGAKEGDSVTWNPQLFVDGVEMLGDQQPTPLPVDPTNENYSWNILEWNYGSVCKRSIRLREGRLRERWVFATNPNGEVKIKHNTSGEYPLRLGDGEDSKGNPLHVQVIDDVELVSASEFSKPLQNYPIHIGASPETFYPDVHPETSSVDGYVARASWPTGGESWADLIANAGTSASDAADLLRTLYIYAMGTANDFGDYRRGIILFNTSGLPDMAKVTAATLSVHGDAKADNLSCTPNLNIYGSTPNSNTALVAGDYNQTQDVALANAIAYGALDIAGYNDFALIDVDTDDFGYIKKTAGDPISKFSAKNANYDVAQVQPNWVSASASYFTGFQSQKGAGFKPKLVVTYTITLPEPVADGDLIGIGLIRKS